MKQQLKQYVSMVGAAEICDMVEGSIRAAIKRGELTLHSTACGKVKLLLVKDVKRWGKQTRRPGPKTGG